MRQIPSITTIAAVLALSLSGCFGQSDTTTTTEESPVTESPVVASPTVPSATPEGSAAQSATPPTPPESSVATLPRNLDLIPSTDPDQRIQSVQRERSDPFSVVPTTPSVQIEILDDGSGAQAGSTASPGAAAGAGRSAGGGSAAGSRGAAGSGAASPGNQSSGGRTAASGGGGLIPTPNQVPGRPAIPTVAPPPPPPQPTLARAVAVLGVVQIGSVPYAIVSAPNEPTSRYVREGQRLSNGQVVVRRIEMNGTAPSVVFEQYGVKVITAVGEGGAPESTEAAPAAVLPAATSQQPG